MEGPKAISQAPMQRRPLLPLGAAGTIFLMLILCAPLVWYASLLLDRHGHAADLAARAPLELLLALSLLVLPFAALRLLRIEWHNSAD